jgi:hypothetical protein
MLGCALSAPVVAQTVPVDTLPKHDTILYVPQMEQHPAGDVTNAVNLEKHLIQNPTAALFKSMVVPGMGQAGNRRWFKAGLFAGLEVWFALKAIDHGQSAHAHKAAFDAATDVDYRRLVHDAYETERSKRNKFVWFFGLTTFVSMFDAYVDAHMSGSPSNKRNDQFSLNVVPGPSGGALASLSLRF